jgi:uncharacterized delta-60 repeat protein
LHAPAQVTPSSQDYAECALALDGKIVVAGTSTGGTTNGDFAVARYNADGTLDSTFGTGGKTLLDFSSNRIDDCLAMALQSDGRIVLVGRTSPPDASSTSIAQARFTTAGALDTGFGSGGMVITSLGVSGTGATDVAIDDRYQSTYCRSPFLSRAKQQPQLT